MNFAQLITINLLVRIVDFQILPIFYSNRFLLLCEIVFKFNKISELEKYKK